MECENTGRIFWPLKIQPEFNYHGLPMLRFTLRPHYKYETFVIRSLTNELLHCLGLPTLLRHSTTRVQQKACRIRDSEWTSKENGSTILWTYEQLTDSVRFSDKAFFLICLPDRYQPGTVSSPPPQEFYFSKSRRRMIHQVMSHFGSLTWLISQLLGPTEKITGPLRDMCQLNQYDCISTYVCHLQAVETCENDSQFSYADNLHNEKITAHASWKKVTEWMTSKEEGFVSL